MIKSIAKYSNAPSGRSYYQLENAKTVLIMKKYKSQESSVVQIIAPNLKSYYLMVHVRNARLLRWSLKTEKTAFKINVNIMKS